MKEKVKRFEGWVVETTGPERGLVTIPGPPILRQGESILTEKEPKKKNRWGTAQQIWISQKGNRVNSRRLRRKKKNLRKGGTAEEISKSLTKILKAQKQLKKARNQGRGPLVGKERIP